MYVDTYIIENIRKSKICLIQTVANLNNIVDISLFVNSAKAKRHAFACYMQLHWLYKENVSTITLGVLKSR